MHDRELGLAPPATASVEAEGERDLRRALRRGWRGRCPACGGGPLFDGYLKVRARCPACSQQLDRHRADDAPTWITILVVGHVVGPGMLTVWDLWNPPIWVHWVLWPTLALSLSLLLLPRFKGAIVGLQWAKRLAGFATPRGR